MAPLGLTCCPGLGGVRVGWVGGELPCVGWLGADGVRVGLLGLGGLPGVDRLVLHFLW